MSQMNESMAFCRQAACLPIEQTNLKNTCSLFSFQIPFFLRFKKTSFLSTSLSISVFAFLPTAGARGKWKGFSHGSAALHSQSARIIRIWAKNWFSPQIFRLSQRTFGSFLGWGGYGPPLSTVAKGEKKEGVRTPDPLSEDWASSLWGRAEQVCARIGRQNWHPIAWEGHWKHKYGKTIPKKTQPHH